jgi:nicotinate-nucleotide adenylyltransferase
LRPLGILGGTFDPIHLGHVGLAQAALEELQLDAVLWMPSGQPGHRVTPIASATDRLAMLELAIAGKPRFRIDATELKAAVPTYTIHTLTRLRVELGAKQPLALVLGADSFLSLPTWLRWEELFDLAHIAVANRPGHLPGQSETPAALAAQMARRSDARDALATSPAGKIASFDMPQLDISASGIRATIARGEAPRDLLSAPVLAYIEAHGLYKYLVRKETHAI